MLTSRLKARFGKRAVRWASSLALAMALVPAGSAWAETIRLTPTEVRQRLVVAADVNRLQDPAAGTQALLLERILQELYAQNPEMPAAEATASIQQIASAMPPLTPERVATLTSYAFNERLLVLLSDAVSTGATGPARKALAVVSRDLLFDAKDAGDAAGRFAVNNGEAFTLLLRGYAGTDVLLRSVRLADANALFAAARDGIWQEAAGFSISAPQSALLELPALQSEGMRALVDAIGADGSLETTVASLQGNAQDQLDHLNEASLTTLKYLRELSDSTAAEINRAAVDANRAAMGGWNSSVAFVQTTFSVPRYNTGQESGALRAASEAASKMADFLDRRAQDAAGKLVARPNMSMAFNVAGMGMMLASFALEQSGVLGPSPEAVMLQQIVALQKQVAELRKEMNERFDQVDTQLGVLSNKLDNLQDAINGVSGAVAAAMTGIAQVQQSIALLRDTVIRGQQADALTPIQEKINNALGYQERQADGSALPGSVFNETESSFYTFGTSGATNDIALPGNSFEIGKAAEMLAAPAGSSTDYLNRFPSGGNSSLIGDTVPNSRFWVLAMRAHQQLLLENPALVTPAVQGRLNTLAAYGQRLVTLQAAITRSTDDKGTNSELFNSLFEGHGLATEAVYNAVKAEQDKLLAEKKAPRNDGRLRSTNTAEQATVPLSTVFSLFGGADQTVPVAGIPALDHIKACSRADLSQTDRKPPPWSESQLRTLFPPALLVGRALGLWNLDACFKAVVTDAAYVKECRHDPFSGRYLGHCWLGHYDVKWHARVTPVGKTENVPVDFFRFTQRMPSKECAQECRFRDSRCYDDPGEDREWWVWNTWTDSGGTRRDGSDFYSCGNADVDKRGKSANPAYTLQAGEGIPSALTTPDEVPAALVTEVEEAIKALQLEARGKVRTALGNSSELGAAVGRLNGYQKLIGEYIRFGFPRTVANDESLADPIGGDTLSRLLDAETLVKVYGSTTISDIKRDALAPRTNYVEISDSLKARIGELIPPKTAGARSRATGSVSLQESSPLVRSALASAKLTISALQAPPRPVQKPSTGTTPPPTTGEPSPQAPVVDVAPVLSAVKLLGKSFSGRRGTKLLFTTTTQSQITVRLRTTRKGVRRGKKCVTGSDRGKRCKKVVVKTLTYKAAAGLNRVTFGKRLRRGTYSATMIATGSSGLTSAPVGFKFKVK